MALRVLLADESTTIKKVMQLALQDFAVDVKAVHSGLDVAEVARSFQPDIVFADVLLAKRNGYDVTAELKADSNLSEIPVVLMWSSFMDIDEAAYSRSKANARLEKPFDVETLRNIVKEYVPRTQTQRIANFLKFPGDFIEPLADEESQKKAAAKTQQNAPGKVAPVTSIAPAAPPPAAPPPLEMAPQPQYTPPPLEQKSSWNMESFDPLPDISSELLNKFDDDEDEDDEPVKMTKLGSAESLTPIKMPETTSASDEGDPWSHQNLSRFKLDIPEQDVEKDEISIVFDMNDLESESASAEFLLNRDEGSTRLTAKIQIPREDSVTKPTRPVIEAEERKERSEGTQRFDATLPQIDTSGFQLEPVGEVAHGDAVISQFAHDDQDVDAGLSLGVDPEDLPPPVTAATPIEYPEAYHSSAMMDAPPVQMTAEEVERIIRAQSQEVIEAVVRRIVPELATEIIKKELARLLAEGNNS